MHLYVLGYRRAAEVVQGELVRSSSEQLVFPFLFLWRQHIELYIKFLIPLAATVHDCDAPTPFGHVLPRLWRELRRLLEMDPPGDEVRSALDAIEEVLRDLEDVDPNAIHSRYAEGRTSDSLVQSLGSLPDHFDPKHFGMVLAKTSDFLDCAHAEYANRLDAMGEAMAANY